MSRRSASAAAWGSRWSSRCLLPEESDPAFIAIAEAALHAIAAHARMEHPRECCGLLIGTDAVILEAVPLENVASDGMRRYEIAPADYAAQIRRCREKGDVAVVGAYHSHPRSEPDPSPTDVAEAFDHFWFLIAGPASGHAPLQVRAYQLVDGNLREARLVPQAEDAA